MIEYTDWNNEESLMDKIEENKVLDLNKQKKKTKKESLKTPTINIGEQHINIASNNKINSDNTIKINSDNTFYAKLSDNQKKMFILGIITIFVMIGIAGYQSYESAMANWGNNSPNEITEQTLAELLKNGKVIEFNKIKHNWTGKINFDGIYLSEMDLTGIDLRYTSLRNANFADANLTESSFEGADLEQANFRNAKFERANLVESNLKGAFLRNADLEQVNLNRADMQDAILFGANLKHASLIKTNLQNADLQYSEFLWANLENAKMDGALLNNTDFREVQNFPISIEEAKERNAIVD